MPNTTWKSYERTIARHFPGAKRRGPGTGDGRNGKSDIICPGWSIETKLLARPSFSDLLAGCIQAERNAESLTDIPVCVVKRLGDAVPDSLCVMRLETFQEFFIGGDDEK